MALQDDALPGSDWGVNARPSFSEWLSTKLGEQRLSQERAARAIDRSKTTVQRWVHGDALPRYRELQAIIRFFGEIPPDLLPEPDETGEGLGRV